MDFCCSVGTLLVFSFPVFIAFIDLRVGVPYVIIMMSFRYLFWLLSYFLKLLLLSGFVFLVVLYFLFGFWWFSGNLYFIICVKVSMMWHVMSKCLCQSSPFIGVGVFMIVSIIWFLQKKIEGSTVQELKFWPVPYRLRGRGGIDMLAL